MVENRLVTEERFKSLSEQDKKSWVTRVQDKKVAFVGISNWKLDASKTNRMIFVARMNMSDDQLSDTAKAIFESYSKRCRFEEKLGQEKYL